MVKTRIEVKTYHETDEQGRAQWVALVEWIDDDGASDGRETVGATPTEALKELIVELATDNAEYLAAIASLTGFE